MELFTTTGGVKKREKYRWNFMFRSTGLRDDYTNIFALVDALNSAAPQPYTASVMGLVDVEEWMRIFATEHIIVNFDAYGHDIGKNMYAYLPEQGKWQLYMFDLDWAMLAGARARATTRQAAPPSLTPRTQRLRACTAILPSRGLIGAPCRTRSTVRCKLPIATRSWTPSTAPWSPTTSPGAMGRP